MLTAEWKLEDALMVREMEGVERGVKMGEARGEARGRLEGELEGEARATRRFINQMFQGGYSVAEIIKVTGFSEKDIKKMLKK